MFSTNLKRSVATLGVVAGLLAAAVPASAQSGGADPPKGPQDHGFRVEIGPMPCARAVDGGDDTLRATVTCLDQDMSTVKAPATPTANGFVLSFEHMDVKAPTNAGTPRGLNTMGGDDTVELRGTQVGSEGVKANSLRGEAIDIIP